MIGKLTGRVCGKRGNSLILDVGGVGYILAVRPETARKAIEESSLSLFTHLAVREDALDLYGFETESELSFFELLLSVSGIGPKSAIAILSLGDVDSLESAIGAGDTAYLTKVSGVGKKSAERIVLELRDKLADRADTAHDLRGDTDALEALQSLGYNMHDAREALKRLDPSLLGTNERLREALKLLGKA